MENYGSDVRMADVFGEDSEYDVGRQLAKEFLEKTGLASLPHSRPEASFFPQRATA